MARSKSKNGSKKDARKRAGAVRHGRSLRLLVGAMAAVAAMAAGIWLVAPVVGAPWWSPLAGQRGGAPVASSRGEAELPEALRPEPVQSFESEGHSHIPIGTLTTYKTDPPTSGPHYDPVAQPGFYEERAPAAGFLVHNLEHGHVVIYYSRTRLSPEARRYLQELTDRYRGTWDAVLAVPRDDDRYELILTAWQHVQRLPVFDREAVDAFIDRFRGRGPERRVR